MTRGEGVGRWCRGPLSTMRVGSIDSSRLTAMRPLQTGKRTALASRRHGGMSLGQRGSATTILIPQGRGVSAEHGCAHDQEGH